jgi:hypothetical protein
MASLGGSVKSEIDDKLEKLSRKKSDWHAVPVGEKAKLLKGPRVLFSA